MKAEDNVYSKCCHPDHNENESCADRAVGCSKHCLCCMEELAIPLKKFKMKNWIKTHRHHTAAIFSLIVTFSGVLMLIPKSPWSLVIGGIVSLMVVAISAFPPDFPAAR